MKNFREFYKDRLISEAGLGIGAPGALPGGPPGMGGPGGPPGMGGPMGGLPPMPPGGPMGGGLNPIGGGPIGSDPLMGGPGASPGGSQQAPVKLKPLDVWGVLERLLGISDDEEPKQPPQPSQPQSQPQPQPQHLMT